MKICPACNEKENDDDERFCITCGLDLDKSQDGNSQVSSNLKPKNTEIKNSSDDKIQGRLVLSDNHILPIDSSQRLVGRADLKKYTEKDQNLISRSHFTVYEKDLKYFIRDGTTNVQNKASESNTIVNEEKLSRNERELKNGDKILVSDVLILFEV
jgi:pSer/pThr/pTyr-binding forkhead associated (FHA) protein